MNPDQRTPRSSERWSTDNDYRREITTSSSPSNRNNEPRASQWSGSSTTRTTRTGTYGMGTSPLPSPPGQEENTTPGQNRPNAGPGAYQRMGRYGIPTPQYILDWDQPMALEQQPIDVPPMYQRCPATGESTLARSGRRLRRQNPIPFPTPRRAIGLPSTSNDDPAQTSDTDTLVDRDVPEQIRIRPDVPKDIPTTITNNLDPDDDQRTLQELLLLET